MEEDFYKGRLTQMYGLEVIVPNAQERKNVQRVIYDELVVSVIRLDSKEQYMDIIERLVTAGAEGIIMGRTEIGLLVRDGDCRVPLFDTTKIHAEAAVEFALVE